MFFCSFSQGAMKAEAYVGIIKRVIPIYHTTKSRKLKGDVDSHLANANIQQELLTKKKRKILQTGNELCTGTYSMQAVEMFFTQTPRFDHKA
nr:hypothetical protein [uncultured Lachnoclostridium sp.]